MKLNATWDSPFLFLFSHRMTSGFYPVPIRGLCYCPAGQLYSRPAPVCFFRFAADRNTRTSDRFFLKRAQRYKNVSTEAKSPCVGKVSHTLIGIAQNLSFLRPLVGSLSESHSSSFPIRPPRRKPRAGIRLLIYIVVHGTHPFLSQFTSLLVFLLLFSFCIFSIPLQL